MKGIRIDYENYKNKNEIIKLYNNGEKSSIISKKFNLSKNTIINFIRKSNIEIRKNKYDFNYEFFKDLNSSEKSWLFGWVLADGCLYNNRLIISLNKKDIDVIIKFSKILNIIKKPYILDNKVNLAIYNRQMAKDLELLGCFSKKSLTLDFPDSVSEEYMKDFIRGYFEGDGGVSFNKNRNCLKISIKCTLQFAEKLKIILKNIDITSTIYKCINTKENVYDLNISGNPNSIKFLNWIYNSTTEGIRLDRKYNKSKDLYIRMITDRKQKSKKDILLEI